MLTGYLWGTDRFASSGKESGIQPCCKRAASASVPRSPICSRGFSTSSSAMATNPNGVLASTCSSSFFSRCSTSSSVGYHYASPSFSASPPFMGVASFYNTDVILRRAIVYEQDYLQVILFVYFFPFYEISRGTLQQPR